MILAKAKVGGYAHPRYRAFNTDVFGYNFGAT